MLFLNVSLPSLDVSTSCCNLYIRFISSASVKSNGMANKAPLPFQGLDVGAMIDGFMSSGEESGLPRSMFTTLTPEEFFRINDQREVSIHFSSTTHNEPHHLSLDGEDEDRQTMIQANLPVGEKLSKQDTIDIGRTRTRNVWAASKASIAFQQSVPVDHDDFGLDEETIPGLEDFLVGRSDNDDALLLAALDGPSDGTLSSVKFDNFYSVEDNQEQRGMAAAPLFGDGPRDCTPRSSRHQILAFSTTGSTHRNPTPGHHDPHNLQPSTGSDEDDDDGMALLAACELPADTPSPATHTNPTTVSALLSDLREVRYMVEELTETEILPFSAPASDDEILEDQLTAKPMTPFEYGQ